MTADPERRPALSIYDLANHLGISSGTVSRALNNRPEVSAATRSRVLEAAAQLGFSPSPLAQGLARNRSQAIGVVIPAIDDPFFHSFARGVQNVALQFGFAVMLSFADAVESVSEAAKSFAAFRASGILILGGSSDADESIASLVGDTPTVVTLRRAQRSMFPSVFVDHEAGARAMTSLLAERGRNSIAFVSLPLNSQAAYERLNGYRSIASEADPAWTVTAPGIGFLDGVQAVDELMSRPAATQIDAIFFASDALATGGLHALAARGINVPEDMAVAGFGDIDSSAVSVPSLTTVRIPMHQIGERAATLLFARMDDVTAAVEELELDLELVERGSTRR